MRVVCDTQRTAEWHAARLGHSTASNADRALAKRRDKQEAADRLKYKIEIAAERLTGKVTNHFVSRWMDEGSEYEDFARAATEVHLDTEILQTGFVLHPKFDFHGASPDGVFPDGGVLEIKCPKVENHLAFILGKIDPMDYCGWQMVGESICCESPYVQFVSYNDFLPKHLRWFGKRYVIPQTGDKSVSAYNLEIEQFETEVASLVSQLSPNRTSVDSGLVYSSEPSPEELAAQDMSDLEATWQW